MEKQLGCFWKPVHCTLYIVQSNLTVCFTLFMHPMKEEEGPWPPTLGRQQFPKLVISLQGFKG